MQVILPRTRHDKAWRRSIMNSSVKGTVVSRERRRTLKMHALPHYGFLYDAGRFVVTPDVQRKAEKIMKASVALISSHHYACSFHKSR